MPANGLFGYTTYDAVKYFEDIRFKNTVDEQISVFLICIIPFTGI